LIHVHGIPESAIPIKVMPFFHAQAIVSLFHALPQFIGVRNAGNGG
jgi:hypothetical protein